MKFNTKTLMLAVRKAVNRAGFDVVRYHKDRLDLYQQLYGEESVKQRRFYNIGAGMFAHAAWTNVDHYSDWYVGQPIGIHYDLLALVPLSVPDNSAELVYSSHTVEHIPNDAAQNMYNEAYRILKPGGIFRVTTPNIELDYHAYRNNDRSYFYFFATGRKSNSERLNVRAPIAQASIQQMFLWHFAAGASTLHLDSPAERITDAEIDRIFNEMPLEAALDYCLARCDLETHKKYAGNHINWWTWDKMSRMLQAAGFETVYRSAYGQSLAPVLRNTALFDNTHPRISLYVEARKG